MTNIRVYELARDLNMTNKALISRLQDIDISVKNHMSSLDNEAVAVIKSNLFGSLAENIEETRVKSTVIRRRKKSVQQAPDTSEAASEPEKHPEMVEADEQPSPKYKEPKELQKKDKIEDKTVKKMAVEKKAPEKVDAPDGGVDQAVLKKKHKPKKPVESKLKEPADLKKLKPKKVARKAKKDTPAKIIKLPVKPPPEEKTPEVKKDRFKKPKAKVAKVPAPKEAVPKDKVPPKDVPVKDKKKKKWTKKPDEAVKDKKFFKKKISFRKKEVVEGSDLYVKGYSGRKGRKGARDKKVVKQKTLITTPKAIKRRIKIDDTIALSDLAKRMGIKAGDMIKKLMDLGVMATVNQTIDFDTAALVATEFEYELEKASFEEAAVLKVEMDDPESSSIGPRWSQLWGMWITVKHLFLM
jgi:translation initiation factor IF-2